MLSHDLRRTLDALTQHGLLLESDAALPSVVTLITGGPVRGSWWGHPQGHDIYQVLDGLADDRDAMLTKLISRKTTFVHRKLWPAVLAVGAAHEPWQLDGLSSTAQRLLEIVSRDSELRTDAIPHPVGSRKDSPGEAARDLERRLLVHGEQFHTETGAHAKRLESWERWAKRAGLRAKRMTPQRGKKKLEDALSALNERFNAGGRLPWE